MPRKGTKDDRPRWAQPPLKRVLHFGTNLRGTMPLRPRIRHGNLGEPGTNEIWNAAELHAHISSGHFWQKSLANFWTSNPTQGPFSCLGWFPWLFGKRKHWGFKTFFQAFLAQMAATRRSHIHSLYCRGNATKGCPTYILGNGSILSNMCGVLF